MNDLLSSGLRLYWKYFTIIAGLVLSIGLPCQSLASYVTYEIFGKGNFVSKLQMHLLTELIFGSLITGGILHALFVDRMGRRADFWECVSLGAKHWFQICWTNFLICGLVAMASVFIFIEIGIWQFRLLFILPALVLGIRLSLAVTVVMTEGEWGLTALKRSLRLTADKSWIILGFFAFVCLPIQAVDWIGLGMLQTNSQFDTWQITAAFGVLLKLVSCFIPVCFFCLYEKVIAEDKPED